MQHEKGFGQSSYDPSAGEQVTAYLNPPAAELLGGVVAEPADVSSDHRDPEDARVEDRWYGIPKIVPFRGVVPGPMCRVLPRTDEGRPAEHERPLPRSLDQPIMSRPGFQEAIKVMRIVLCYIPKVNCRCRHCLVVDRSSNTGIVDAIRRLIYRVHRRRGYEVRYLVHVNPQAVDRKRLPESGDLPGPEICGGRVQEVREVDRSGPHTSKVVLLPSPQEDTLLHPPQECAIGAVDTDTYNVSIVSEPNRGQSLVAAGPNLDPR